MNETTTTTRQRTSRQTTWPVGWYLATMAFSFSLLVCMTPWLNEWLSDGARTLAQYGLAMLLMTRLITAIKSREQNHQGQFYITGMLLLPVFWYALEMFILPAMQRWMR